MDLGDIDQQRTGENSMIFIPRLVLLESPGYVHAEIKMK
jgi:hypothetical protein